MASVCTSFHVDTGWFELRETESREDASFELTDLLADEHHTLCAWKEGLAPLFFDMPREERTKNDWDVGVLRFARPASLGGTAVSADGSVLAGVRIRLNGLGESVLEKGDQAFRDARGLRTDDDGRFLATDLAPGRYTLTFAARRMRNDFSTEVVVAEADEKRLGRITMPANFLDEGR